MSPVIFPQNIVSERCYDSNLAQTSLRCHNSQNTLYIVLSFVVTLKNCRPAQLCHSFTASGIYQTIHTENYCQMQILTVQYVASTPGKTTFVVKITIFLFCTRWNLFSRKSNCYIEIVAKIFRVITPAPSFQW